MNETIKADIRLRGSSLAIGESAELSQCPFCNVSHEKKFSLKRTENGLLFNCFRATCRASGFVPDFGQEARVQGQATLPLRKPWIDPLGPLTELDEDFFYNTWNIPQIAAKVTSDDRYAFPINSPFMEVRGWVIRNPVWKGRECHRKGVLGVQKAMTYKNEPHYPKGGFYCRLPEGYPPHIVLTEDYLSAAKVSIRSCIGYTLNGTDLEYGGVCDILELKPYMVTIFLDPGAERQAYRILDKWGLSFNACRVVTADKDPKDLSYDELEEILNVRW